MRNRLPAFLAIVAATQWAPLRTDVIQADDKSSSANVTAETENYLEQLQNQGDPDEVLCRSEDAEKKYLKQDTNILMNPEVPSASVTEGNMRDTVYILDEDGEYVEISDQGKTGWVLKNALADSLSEIFDDVNQAMYVAQDNVTVYTLPDSESAHLTVLNQNDTVTLTGTSSEELYRIQVNNQTGYIDKNTLSDHALTFSERLSEIRSQTVSYTWTGAVLTPSSGSVTGPSGKETYYNLDMSVIVSVMRSMGFGEMDYPYWVRSDGAKMLGPYVMVAADLNTHPKGSIIDISLGKAIVTDTGAFTTNGSGTAVDVAVTW